MYRARRIAAQRRRQLSSAIHRIASQFRPGFLVKGAIGSNRYSRRCDDICVENVCRSNAMPRKETVRKARQDKREGKSPSTQAGELVREEIEEIRRGRHGARSPQQAIAIGLSEARRAGVDLPPPKKGRAKARMRRSAKYSYDAGQGRRKPRRRPRVSSAVKRVLKNEPRRSASRRALSRQAKRAANSRSAASRSAAARKAARTKGAKARSTAAKKAARTRARRRR